MARYFSKKNLNDTDIELTNAMLNEETAIILL